MMDANEEGEGLDLSATYEDRDVPAGVEDVLVGRLRGEGLLVRSDAPWRHWPLRAAAGLVLFAAGWSTNAVTSDGRGAVARPGAVTAADDEARTMMVLWEGPTYEPAREPEERVAEYAAWARAVAGQGISVEGAELEPERRVFPERLAGAEELGATEELGTIGGYFILGVDDATRVADLAAGHPHVVHGGSIEVRRLR